MPLIFCFSAWVLVSHINSCVHSTVIERSWGARHRLGTQGAKTRPLICWHHHLVQELEDTNSGEKNKFYYLARTIICSPSVEQEGVRCDRNQRDKSIYYQAHGKSWRARIGRVTWDSKVWLSLLLLCVEWSFAEGFQPFFIK